MARYFSYLEVTSRQLPTVKDVGWLAGQVTTLPPFRNGSAVLCGSVAWGTHSARSDIDIAHFGTTKHPQVEAEIEAVVELYEKHTKCRLIAPRIDVITVGVEPDVSSDLKTNGASVGEDNADVAGTSINGVFVLKKKRSMIFADTFVRFTDHIGSLAHVKGGVWKKFLDAHLSPPHKDHDAIQQEAIRSYVTNTTTTWEMQPLHSFNLEANYELSQRQLDLMGQAENYPVNLMRRILGAMGHYPRPDRIPDVRAAFSGLTQPWARRLVADAAPFFELDAQYRLIIEDIRKSNSGLSAEAYHERLCTVFESLPFGRIQETVWEYLGQH